MADPFTPKFVDLVKNNVTTTGTVDFTLGTVPNGFTSFQSALQVGDRFYYSCLGVDKPAEREVGRGTLLSGGKIAREPISGPKTNFTTGTKAISLIAAAEWFGGVAGSVAGATSAAQAANAAAASATSAVATVQANVETLESDVGALEVQVASLDTELDGTTQNLADLSATVAAMGDGSASSVALRAALAQVPSASGAMILREPGREGVFVWDPSNLQALVTADTAQGIVVPPSGGNGSTGAWVRKFDGAANARWFGLSPAASAAANSAAIAAALNAIKARAVTGVGYSTGGEQLHIPTGGYDFAGPITLDFAAHLTGDYVGGFSGGGTVLNFPASSHGIATTKDVGTCRVEGFQIRGDSAVPGSGFNGLHCRGKIIATRLYINGFEHGIDCFGAFSSDLTNTNGSSFSDIATQSNVWGTWTDGPDANNILFSHVHCITNHLGGHLDGSFLGCIYEGGDCSSNGGPNGTTYKSRCHVSGHIYMCLKNQEAWCSTNAPTGAATSNQGWLYIGEGAANAAQPEWVTAQTWYFSAPFAMDPDNNNARSVFRDLYVEPDQNPSIMTWPGIYYRGFDTGTTLSPGGTRYSGVIGAGFGGEISLVMSRPAAFALKAM